MSETQPALDTFTEPATGETVSLPPASGQVIEITPRGAPGEAPGLGSGTGEGVGAGEGIGAPGEAPAQPAGQSYEDYRAERNAAEVIQRAQQRQQRARRDSVRPPVAPQPEEPRDRAAEAQQYAEARAQQYGPPASDAGPGAEVAPPERPMPAQPAGLRTPGNIDLNARPVVRNRDGSISTVRSMSVNFGDGEVLIPTVSDDGRVLSDDEAVDLYRRTGRHLGIFDTPENATAYAERLHTEQDALYSGRAPDQRGPRQPRRTPETQATARTVARTASEMVLGVPRGVVGAFAAAFEAADDLADWLNARVPLSSVPAGDPGTPGRTVARQIRGVQSFIGREPETMAGRVTEEISQFVTGFLRGNAVLRSRGVLQGGGAARQSARAAMAGAIADAAFNEADESNLANLWQRLNLPGQALADFLATKPEDEAAVNRLRNAAAGVMVGATIDGLLALARVARAARTARQETGAPAPAAEPATLAEAAQIPPRPERDLLIVGDPSRPLVEMRPAGDAEARMVEAAAATSDAAIGVPADVAARGLANAPTPVDAVENTAAIRSATDPGDVFINWGRISTAEDVQAVIRDMAEAFRGNVNEAGRGVQSNDETARLAAMLNLSVPELLSRQRGEVWNAERALASRQLYTASGERLLEAARMAAAPGAGPVEQAAFRRMMAVHYAIQSEVLGARREAGRALQAWAIPAASGGRQMRMIEDLLEASGGVDVSRAMAKRLEILGQQLPADQLAPALGEFTNRGVFGRSIEAVQQYWINALLSNPATHAANIVGNGLNIPLTMLERGMQGAIGRATGSADAAMAAEVPVMLYGLLTGFRDSLRMAARSYRDDGQEIAAMIGRQDLPRQGAISSQAWGVDAGSGLGRALDFVGHSVISAPGRAMGAEDAFFKSSIFRMELHAQALRQAVREVPLAADGTLDAAAIGARMGEIVRHPPESVMMAAADEALYRTFNREAGPIASRLLQLRNTDSPGWNLLMSTVLPFVRTPANIFSYSLERTPLAPLVGQWRADIAAGGARRDAAMARISLGSMILAHTYQLAEQDLVTGKGPTDPQDRAAWERNGNQPYSIRIGDVWVPFNRLDPYGFILGFAADMREFMDRRDLGEREELEAKKLMAAATQAVAAMLTDRSFFSGVASVAEAINPQQPSADRYIDRTIGSLLVPGIVAAGAQAVDPTRFDRGQGWMTDRLGGLMSEPGIPRRNQWGEVMMRPGADVLGPVGAAMSPVRPTRAAGRPIDRELIRLGMGLEAVDRNGAVMFGKAPVNLRNVNPAALDHLRVLAGNGITLPGFGGRGMADALDEMVQGQGPYGAAFQRASDAGREAMIRRAVSRFREAARDALLADPRFADVAALVEQRQAEEGEGEDEAKVIPGSRAAAQRPPGEAAPPRRRPPQQQQPALR